VSAVGGREGGQRVASVHSEQLDSGTDSWTVAGSCWAPQGCWGAVLVFELSKVKSRLCPARLTCLTTDWSCPSCLMCWLCRGDQGTMQLLLEAALDIAGPDSELPVGAPRYPQSQWVAARAVAVHTATPSLIITTVSAWIRAMHPGCRCTSLTWRARLLPLCPAEGGAEGPSHRNDDQSGGSGGRSA